MAVKMYYVLVLAVVVLVLAMSSVADGQMCRNLCGWQGGGLECPDNQCCSQNGECGLGDYYCGAGCQSGVCQPNNRRCGWRFGYRTCSNNYCCSRSGYCGFGDEYCTGGCQSGFCYTTLIPCSAKKLCPGNMCCGPKAWCGIGGAYCGDGCRSGPCYYPRGTVATAANDSRALPVGSSTLQES